MARLHISAKQEYLKTQEKKSTRRGLTYTLVLILLVWAFASGVFADLSDTWFFVLVIGVICPIVVFIFRQLKAAKSSESRYLRGRMGEYLLLRVLNKLLDEKFDVFYDMVLPNSRGNLDIVVVGPTGIYVLDAKTHRGTIGYANNMLTRSGKQFEKDFIAQITTEVEDLNRFLGPTLARSVQMNPVIVFVSSIARITVRGPIRGGVRVFSSEYAAGFILRNPKTLSETECQNINAKLKTLDYAE